MRLRIETCSNYSVPRLCECSRRVFRGLFVSGCCFLFLAWAVCVCVCVGGGGGAEGGGWLLLFCCVCGGGGRGGLFSFLGVSVLLL